MGILQFTHKQKQVKDTAITKKRKRPSGLINSTRPAKGLKQTSERIQKYQKKRQLKINNKKKRDQRKQLKLKRNIKRYIKSEGRQDLSLMTSITLQNFFCGPAETREYNKIRYLAPCIKINFKNKINALMYAYAYKYVLYVVHMLYKTDHQNIIIFKKNNT